jgi:hypothetical protein
VKTSSGKAKGRALQNAVRDLYRSIGKDHGLVDGDIEARPMGQNGVDIILSPAAKRVFDHEIECKKHKQVRVPANFKEHFAKYKTTSGLKLLFHEDNYSEPLVTMRAVDFIELVGRLIKTTECSVPQT